MNDKPYDLVVIGGGPGGYVAALRAAQLGLRTVCVDKRETLGGTCLNVGCIPSKALLNSSERYESARDELSSHGVCVDGVSLDLAAMMARKDGVVAGLTKGIDFLFGKNKVERLVGSATIVSPTEVRVTPPNGEPHSLSARHILIATGSEPLALPGIEFDEKRIVSSTGALALSAVPKHLVVVGGGYIGLELGSVWRRLGSKVTVVEFLDRIVPNMDRELGRHLQRLLKKQGLAFRLETKVAAARVDDAGVTLSIEPAAGGKAETLEADVVLIAVGRRPYTEGLGLEAVGIERDERGFIRVDADYRTNIPGIHAIGDVIPGPMLAHLAEEEGIAAVELMAGHAARVNYEAIPGVAYTAPEAASVGRTEEELKEAGIAYSVGKFPFAANSRARCTGATEGFVKILAEEGTDRILGVHILGADAGTLIAEAVLALEYGASSEDIARTCHAHPTLSEALKEAALAAGDGAIHA
jgi:dihydrolipoamide dehydrogenase